MSQAYSNMRAAASEVKKAKVVACAVNVGLRCLEVIVAV